MCLKHIRNMSKSKMCPNYVHKLSKQPLSVKKASKLRLQFGHILDNCLLACRNCPNFKICVQNVSQICLKIWTHYGHLDFNGHDKEFSPKCYGRSHLAPAGNTCYMLVTYWTKLRTLVGHIWSGTNCDQIVPGVTICYHV